ncbi:MAG: hypothetical protein GY810_09535 [Aureispira sp.]|nr:hypothetical protein [Aureispira sp.]
MPEQILDYDEQPVKKNDIDRLFWVDFAFFAVFLLIYCFYGTVRGLFAENWKIFFASQWMLSSVYLIIFPFVVLIRKKNKARFTINLIRFPLLFIVFTAVLYSFNQWPGAHEMMVIGQLSLALYFCFFSIYELIIRKSQPKLLAIPSSIAIVAYILGVLFKINSWPYGTELLTTGLVLMPIILISLAFFYKRTGKQFLIRYFSQLAFFLIFHLLVRPTNTINSTIINAFFDLAQ